MGESTSKTGSTCHSLRNINRTSVDKNETENENNIRFSNSLEAMIGRTKKRIVGKIIWGPRKSHLKENGAVSNIEKQSMSDNPCQRKFTSDL